MAAKVLDATPEEIRGVLVETFGSELSEEQLAAIAGGFNEPTFVIVGSLVGGSVLVASALTASAAVYYISR